MKKIVLFGCLCATISMSSCYTAKIAHGSLNVDSPVVKVNSKKNHALIEGLIPLNSGWEAKKYIGDRKDYVTKSQMTFIDGFVGLITLGIYTPTTTTFYVPLSDVSTK